MYACLINTRCARFPTSRLRYALAYDSACHHSLCLFHLVKARTTRFPVRLIDTRIRFQVGKTVVVRMPLVTEFFPFAKNDVIIEPIFIKFQYNQSDLSSNTSTNI